MLILIFAYKLGIDVIPFYRWAIRELSFLQLGTGVEESNVFALFY